MPKAWRRTSRIGLPSTWVAHVVSVHATGSSIVVWTFDTIVTSIGNTDGLQLNGGDTATATISIVGPVVTLDYSNPKFPGDTWEFYSALAAMVFSPTATIADDAGTVI